MFMVDFLQQFLDILIVFLEMTLTKWNGGKLIAVMQQNSLQSSD